MIFHVTSRRFFRGNFPAHRRSAVVTAQRRVAVHIGARWTTCDANICDLPTELKALILSHVDGVDTRVALASVSRTWRNAARLPESRPARYDSMLLRVLRESCLSLLKGHWPESQAPEEWGWVRMEDDRVVRLTFRRTLGLF